MKKKVTKIRNSLDGLNNSLDQLKRELVVNQEMPFKKSPRMQNKEKYRSQI